MAAATRETTETKKHHEITCKHYRSRPNQKHCVYFLPNGVCYRPDAHLCTEWLKINKNIRKFAELKAEAARIELIAFCEKSLGSSPFSIVGLAGQQHNDDPFELPETAPKPPQCDVRRSKLNITTNTHRLEKGDTRAPTASTDTKGFALKPSPKPITTVVPASKSTKTQYLVRENVFHGNRPAHIHGTNGTAQRGNNLQDIVSPALLLEEIESFKALEAEVCIEAPAGEIWIVPRYTQANRKEFIPEDLALLSAACRTFPGSTISKVERIQPSNKETSHAK